MQFENWVQPRVQVEQEDQEVASSDGDLDLGFYDVQFSLLTPVAKEHIPIVFKACQETIEAYSTGIDASSYPVSPETISLDKIVQLPWPDWNIAQGLLLFLESPEWEDCIDTLLEHASPLEQAFSAFISQAQQSEVSRKRLRSKTIGVTAYGYPAPSTQDLQFWRNRGFTK